MTISSTTVKNSYLGNGTLDTFNYTFKIFADSDLQVIIRSSLGTETVKTLTTHYTVTGAGSASGGTIVFTAGNIPSATETVVIRRAVPQTQAIDYIANDPFPAESHEEGLDRSMMAIQQVQEELDRAIKISRTNTMSSTEFTVGASNRAGKILGFDSAGELVVSQELGSFQGNWTSGETYAARDIVKDTSNGNIYLCNTGHTSSGAEPISTNTDSAKWDLLVDAETATSSATAAASSATAAAASASAAATSESNAATSETNAGTSETNAASSASSASTSATNASNSATSASTSASNASTSETNASNSATAAASSATTAGTEATNASNSATAASTSATNAASSASAASTSASNASTSETNASNSASAASTSATNASNSATAAATAQAAAEAALDNFDDVYLGAKSSDPTVDNDGDPLNAGDLYFNTSSSNLKYYDGSAWVAITSGGITDLVQDGTPQLGGQLDVNGFAIGDGTLELLKFSETASAVNELTITNSATGNAPEISSTGDDTNVDIKITPKGSGNVVLDGIKFPNADGTADQVLKTDGSGNLSFTDVSGGISWQSVQTTGFTAVAGNGYFCNTTSAGFTVTLPATPSAGDQIQLVDYAGTFDTNPLVINPNGNKIEGGTDSLELTGEREGVTLTYIDSTQGWLATSGINEGTDALSPQPINFLVVAGGGGGGYYFFGGGGGAGGYRTSSQEVTSGTVITVTVGDGGAGSTSSPVAGTSGSDSSISGTGLTTITSAGGGGGIGSFGGGGAVGIAGGSGGGGGGGNPSSSSTAGGAGNTPSTAPSQGNSGGSGSTTGSTPNAKGLGGGGGGAGAVGSNGTGGQGSGASGGAGTASSITGSSVTYAGGGGGCGDSAAGSGGSGGGGDGAIYSPSTNATSGTINLGGGGGGASHSGGGSVSGNGGKGVVILSVPTVKYSSTSTGSPTVTTSGSNTILTFTGSGSYTA